MLFIDRSGNGYGANVDPETSVVDVSAGDVRLPSGCTHIRATGAGNLVFRPAGASADMTIAMVAGELIPIDGSSLIRQTGTTATGLTAHRQWA